MIGGRFERQLPIFGEDGQERIMSATIGVAGCGGLGVTLVTELAEAGVSHFVLADPDYPEISNLNRQFIYAMSDPRPKAEISAQWITAINPLAEIEVHAESFREGTETMFDCCDIIVDCLDSIKDKLSLSDYAYSSGKTLVHGGVCGLEGQIAVSVPGKTPSLREMIGTSKGDKDVPSVGAAVSAIASLQAVEVLKIASGMGTENEGKLITLDLRTMTMEKIGF